MRKHKMAFLVSAVTALGFVGVPDAVAAPRVVLLENLPGASTSSASDINNSGVVVGESGGRAVRWALAGVPTALDNPATSSGATPPVGTSRETPSVSV